MEPQVPSEIVHRRNEIGDAISHLERMLATAAGTGEVWRTHVTAAIDELRRLVDVQIAAYEADDGVFDDIIQRAPRLVPHVDRVRSDIEPLPGRLDDLRAAVTAAEPDAVRDQALGVLAAIVRARHHIADLVWDAYSVDIGGPH